MFNGLLLIDKPILYTSHDVVDAVRRILGERRVGHAGTLDPMATGLLIVMVGPSTTLFDTLSGHDKSYEGIMTLGFATQTQDAEGAITASADPGAVAAVTAETVERSFAQFIGAIDQKAPLYSAVKKDGQKGYEAARKGKGHTFDPPVRRVEVKSFRLEAFSNPDAYFSCRVSSGTYIRALASDVGNRIGIPMTLTSLRRTSCGELDLRDALTLDQLKQIRREDLAQHLEKNRLRAAIEKNPERNRAHGRQAVEGGRPGGRT